MNELLKINTTDSERITVSARELHKALGVEKRFSAWFETNSQGFLDGSDYTGVPGGTPVQGGNGNIQYLNDYQLTIDMAKHLCLISRTEAGKKYRTYLIQVENEWNSPEKVMARALVMANKKIATLISSVEEMKPKALFADAVAQSDTSILVYDLAKLICQNGVKIGGNRLWTWLRDNGYIFKHSCEPTQKSMEMKLFEVVERTVQRSGHDPKVTRTTRVTGKGQQYFINKFLGS